MSHGETFTVQQHQPGPTNIFWPIIRCVQNKKIGVHVIFRPITAKAVWTLNILRLHSTYFQHA